MRRDCEEREEDSEERRSKMRAKEDKLRSWKENKVYREVERKEEHGLSRKIMTKKL